MLHVVFNLSGVEILKPQVPAYRPFKGGNVRIIFVIWSHLFKLFYAPPVILFWPFQGGCSDVALCCLFSVAEFWWRFASCLLIKLLDRFGLLSDNLLGKSCPLG